MQKITSAFALFALCATQASDTLGDASTTISWSVSENCGNPLSTLVDDKEVADNRLQSFKGIPLSQINHQDFADANREQGRLDRAIKFWSDADNYISIKNWEMARTSLQSLRILAPHIGSIHCIFAHVLVELGDSKQAILSFEQAMQSTTLPDAAQAHTKLGSMYRAMGDVRSAARHFREAIKLDHAIAAAHHGLASCLDVGYEELSRLQNSFAQVHHIEKQTGSNQVGERSSARKLDPTDDELQEAFVHYQHAIDLGADSPALRARLAMLYIYREEWSAASDHLSHAVQQWPQSVEAHHMLSLVLQTRGFILESVEGAQSNEVSKLFQLAIFHLQQATWLDRNAFEPQMHLAELLWVQNRFNDALSHGMTSVQLRPLSVRANVVLSYILESLNRVKEAIEKIEVALKLISTELSHEDSSYAPYLVTRERVLPWVPVIDQYPLLVKRLAELLVQDGDVELAAVQFEEYVRMVPNSPDALLTLGETELRAGNFDDARNRFNEVITMCTSGNTTSSTQDGQQAQAAKKTSLETATECFQALGAARVRLASMLNNERVQAHNGVIELYESAFETGWDDLDARLAVAAEYSSGNQLKRALKHLKVAVSKWPGKSEGHHALGKLLLMQKSYPESHHFFQLATLLDPECIQCHIGNGESFLYIGKTHRALDSFRTALKLSGPKGNPLAQLRMGDVLMKLGKYEIARESYVKTLRLLQSIKNSEKDLGSEYFKLRMIAQNNLAVTYFHEGDLMVAVHWFKETIQKDPRNRVGHTNLAQIFSITGSKYLRPLYHVIVSKLTTSTTKYWNSLDPSKGPFVLVPPIHEMGGNTGNITLGIGPTEMDEHQGTWLSLVDLCNQALVESGEEQIMRFPHNVRVAIDFVSNMTLESSSLDASELHTKPELSDSNLEHLASVDNLSGTSAPQFATWVNWKPHEELESSLEHETGTDFKRPLSVCSEQVNRNQGVGMHSASSFIELGQMLVESQDIAEAIKCFTAVVKSRHGSLALTAQSELAFALELADDWEQALTTAIAVLNQIDYTDKYHLGLILLASRLSWGIHGDVYQVARDHNGKDSQALMLTRMAVKGHPNDPSANFLRASLLAEKQEFLSLKEVDEAFQCTNVATQHIDTREPDSALILAHLNLVKLEMLRWNPRSLGGNAQAVQVCESAKINLAEYEKTNRALLVVPDSVSSWRREVTGWRASRSRYMMELGSLYPEFSRVKSQLMTLCGEVYSENRQLQDSADSYLAAIRSQGSQWSMSGESNGVHSEYYHPVRAYNGLARLLKRDMQPNLANALLRAAVLSKEKEFQASGANSTFSSQREARDTLETQLMLARSLVENGQSAWAVIELLELVTSQNPFKDVRGYALELMVKLLRRFGNPGEANRFLHELMDLLRNDNAVVNQDNILEAEHLSMNLIKEQVLLQDAESYLEKAKELVENEEYEHARSHIALALSMAPSSCRSRLLTMAARLRRTMGDGDWIRDLKQELHLVDDNNQKENHVDEETHQVHPSVVLEVANALKVDDLDVQSPEAIRVFKPLLGSEYFELHEHASVILPLINMQSILQQAGVFDRIRKQWWKSKTALELEVNNTLPFYDTATLEEEDILFSSNETACIDTTPFDGLQVSRRSDVSSRNLETTREATIVQLAGPLTQEDQRGVEERKLQTSILNSLGLKGTRTHVLRQMSKSHAAKESWFTSLVYHRMWIMEANDESVVEAHVGAGTVLLELMRMPLPSGKADVSELQVLGLDHFRRALKHLKEAHRTLDQSSSSVLSTTNHTMLCHCGIGLILMDQNRTKDALVEFEHAIQYTKTVDDETIAVQCGQVGKATVLAMQGEFTESLSLFDSVFGKSADGTLEVPQMVSPQALVWYAWLTNPRDSARSRYSLESAVTIARNEAEVQAALGNAYFIAKQFRSAEKAYQSAFNLEYSFPSVLLNNLAITRAALGKLESSISMLKQALVKYSKPEKYTATKKNSISTLVSQTPLSHGQDQEQSVFCTRYNLALVYMRRKNWEASLVHLRELQSILRNRSITSQAVIPAFSGSSDYRLEGIENWLDQTELLLVRVLIKAESWSALDQALTSLTSRLRVRLKKVQELLVLHATMNRRLKLVGLEQLESKTTQMLVTVLREYCGMKTLQLDQLTFRGTLQLLSMSTLLVSVEAGIRLTGQVELDMDNDPLRVWDWWLSANGGTSAFSPNRVERVSWEALSWIEQSMEALRDRHATEIGENYPLVMERFEIWREYTFVENQQGSILSVGDELEEFAIVKVWPDQVVDH